MRWANVIFNPISFSTFSKQASRYVFKVLNTNNVLYIDLWRVTRTFLFFITPNAQTFWTATKPSMLSQSTCKKSKPAEDEAEIKFTVMSPLEF